MRLDLEKLASQTSLSTGLAVEPHQKTDAQRSLYSLRPVMYDPINTFFLELEIGWRHIIVRFVPGAFSADLIKTMSGASDENQKLFYSLMQMATKRGATTKISINGVLYNSGSELPWHSSWKNFSLELRIGHLAPEEDSVSAAIAFWLKQLIGIIFCIIPVVQSDAETSSLTFDGYPEGAIQKIEVNRYERDPRNRAIALSFHGSRCSACDLSLDQVYGEMAADLIEFHHLVPVSTIGTQYIFDPKEDLVPLCPNCHAVAHRQSPPLRPNEIAALLDNSGNDEAD